MNTYICIGLLMCICMASCASVPVPELQQIEVAQVVDAADVETLQPEESRYGHGHYGGHHWGHHGGHHGGHHWGHHGGYRGHHWGHRG